jgi:hypothetical protein
LRLWSLNPTYLDQKGLGAVWREALLAQKVLLGKTKGWKNHPQLIRFKKNLEPINSIGYYLTKIFEEGCERGYNYNKSKIFCSVGKIDKINISKGQIIYEFKILKERVKKRDYMKFLELVKYEKKEICPKPHPLFSIIDGEVEPWEKSYWEKVKTKNNLNKQKN